MGEKPPWYPEVENGERDRPSVWEVALAYPDRAVVHVVGAVTQGLVVGAFACFLIDRWLYPVAMTAVLVIVGALSASFWWMDMDSANRGWIVIDQD